jgi:hypothetical protein
MRMKVTAALAGAGVLAAALIGNDLASAHQSIAGVAQKRAAAAAAAANCNITGSGCLTNWTPYQHGVEGDPATADVLIIGDSIANRCRSYLRQRLTNAGYSSAVDYWSSRPSADAPAVSSSPGAVTRALSYSRIYQPNSFKAVVMATGTNDVLLNPSGMAAQTARMKGIDSPVIWGSVYMARPSTYSADLRNAGWVNQQITGYPIADWFAFLASYPGYRIGAYISSDGVHPTFKSPAVLGDGSGCDAWAAVYTSKIVQVIG